MTVRDVGFGVEQRDDRADRMVAYSLIAGAISLASAIVRSIVQRDADPAMFAFVGAFVVLVVLYVARSRIGASAKGSILWVVWTLAGTAALLRFGMAGNGLPVATLGVVSALVTLKAAYARAAAILTVLATTVVAILASLGTVDPTPVNVDAFLASPFTWGVALTLTFTLWIVLDRFFGPLSRPQDGIAAGTTRSDLDNAARASALLDLHDEGKLDTAPAGILRAILLPVGSFTLALIVAANLIQLLILGSVNRSDVMIATVIPALLAPPVVGWLVWQNRRLTGTFSTLDRMRDATRTAIYDSMASLSLLHDRETGDHLARCSSYALVLQQACVSHGVDGADRLDRGTLAKAVTLHDIGKVGIPDAILSKPGPLDPDEMRAMQEHARMGSELIATCQERNRLLEDPVLVMGRDVAIAHHENWDGTGYPHGLTGHDIPLAARIMAIIDVYDALRSERPYKPAMDADTALATMRAMAPSKFDPAIFAAFEHVATTFDAIARNDHAHDRPTHGTTQNPAT